MAAGIGARFAGKALNDFLKVVTTLGSTAVEQAVLNKLTAKYSPTVEKYAVYPPRTDAEIIKKPFKPAYSLHEDKNEAASTRIGKFVNKVGAKNIANLVGAVAPVATVGGTILGAGIVQQVLGGGGGKEQLRIAGEGLPGQRQPLYSQQPFVPGTLPLTNAQASEAMLEQMKLQHQLQVIQARQAAGQSQGMAYPNTDIDGILGIASKIYG